MPNSQNFLIKQELNTLSELYAIDIKDCEIEIFRSFIARQDESQLDTLIDVLDGIDKDIFPDECLQLISDSYDYLSDVVQG